MQQQPVEISKASEPRRHGASCLHLDPHGQIVLSGQSSGFPLVESLGGLSTQLDPNDPSATQSPTDISAGNLYQQSSSSTMPDMEEHEQSPLRDDTTQTGTPESRMEQICPEDVWRMVQNVAHPAHLEALIGHHFSVGATWPILHRPSFVSVSGFPVGNRSTF
jgi:hypothetical protein